MFAHLTDQSVGLANVTRVEWKTPSWAVVHTNATCGGKAVTFDVETEADVAALAAAVGRDVAPPENAAPATALVELPPEA
jgi:hypothetical protein